VQNGGGAARIDVVDVVAWWTGGRADALRLALRMTNESFAGRLGVAVRTVAYWRARPDVLPRPALQEVLDTALAVAPAPARAQFALILAERGYASPEPSMPPLAEDLLGLTAWLAASDTSDGAIGTIGATAVLLAGRHTRAPARGLLADVLQVHGRAQLLLRGGLRLRQTRELVRIEGSVLAHASVLLGDLGRDRDAAKYGQAALAHLEEAEASPAAALYALAKAARWHGDYASAVDLARRGTGPGRADPMSVQLAYYEANSAALLGDRSRARQALSRADQLAETLPADRDSGSPWSFPAERRAVFRVSVLLRTGDPRGALAAAEVAGRSWAADDAHIPGAWAQIRIGSAIAHLQQGCLDGATEEVSPVLTLAPELRIATVTGWLADLDTQLGRPRFAGSRAAESLRQQTREFQAAALPLHVSETR
jgi:tetratricopeptide (TPR) repeat protein